MAFYNNKDNKEHVAIVHGDVLGAEEVPVRVHSECLTGDVIGSLRCDCRDQLESALRMIGAMERGMLLYLRQEGRGIGLVNKIRAYGLQDTATTPWRRISPSVSATTSATTRVAAHMLGSLHVKSIRLITNNPKKIEDLSRNGIRVAGRIPHVMPANDHNRFYLETKALKSGHLIDTHGKEHLAEQADAPVIEGMTEDVIAAVRDLYS